MVRGDTGPPRAHPPRDKLSVTRGSSPLPTTGLLRKSARGTGQDGLALGCRGCPSSQQRAACRQPGPSCGRLAEQEVDAAGCGATVLPSSPRTNPSRRPRGWPLAPWALPMSLAWAALSSEAPLRVDRVLGAWSPRGSLPSERLSVGGYSANSRGQSRPPTRRCPGRGAWPPSAVGLPGHVSVPPNPQAEPLTPKWWCGEVIRSRRQSP